MLQELTVSKISIIDNLWSSLHCLSCHLNLRGEEAGEGMGVEGGGGGGGGEEGVRGERGEEGR